MSLNLDLQNYEGHKLVVGRVIKFVRHCLFLAFRVDDQYFFPYSITRLRLYLLLEVVVSFDRFALLFYRHSVYTSAMAEKSEFLDFPG